MTTKNSEHFFSEHACILMFGCHSLKKFAKLTTKLASLASEESRRGFAKRMSLLKQLVSAWENGENLALVEA